MNAIGDLRRVRQYARNGQNHASGCASQQEALALLLEAYQFAQEVRRSVWDFAVEADLLREYGMTVNNFRWLICMGFVEHAREVTQAGELGRQFRPQGELVFSKRTCFVLTEAGVRYLQGEHPTTHVVAQPASPLVFDAAVPIELPREQILGNEYSAPKWDCDRRELRYFGALVKQFKLPSPNQEHILMAFEEDGWPPRIDDPLPPHPEFEPKQRLRETIRSLNRNQKERLVRFKGDGTGEGVLWEPSLPENSSPQLAGYAIPG